VVDRSVLFDGFEQARGRFVAALDDVEGNSAYFALFEALNWAVSLDELVAKTSPAGWKWRDGAVDGDLVRALRYARNRVHHQWADAIRFQPDDSSSSGRLGLMVLGRARLGGIGTPASWRWRALPELPPATRPDADGEAAYGRLLAGHSPPLTLNTLRRVLEATV